MILVTLVTGFLFGFKRKIHKSFISFELLIIQFKSLFLFLFITYLGDSREDHAQKVQEVGKHHKLGRA